MGYKKGPVRLSGSIVKESLFFKEIKRTCQAMKGSPFLNQTIWTFSIFPNCHKLWLNRQKLRQRWLKSDWFKKMIWSLIFFYYADFSTPLGWLVQGDHRRLQHRLSLIPSEFQTIVLELPQIETELLQIETKTFQYVLILTPVFVIWINFMQ